MPPVAPVRAVAPVSSIEVHKALCTTLGRKSTTPDEERVSYYLEEEELVKKTRKPRRKRKSSGLNLGRDMKDKGNFTSKDIVPAIYDLCRTNAA